MLIKILFGCAALLAVLVVIVASRPSDFCTTRMAVIGVPPVDVFPHVNDLRRWKAWSPWEKMDPNAAHHYEGPTSGTGAAFSWAGNSKVGEGKMTITESRPSELIRFRLEFLKPFKATNAAEFTFEPEGGGTRVKWSMSGKANFFFKFMGLFMDCDKMVGSQFEEGLAQLKVVSESVPKAEPVRAV